MSHNKIQPLELQQLLTAGCNLIDVREPVEYAEEHISGARLIPLAQLEKRHQEIDARLPVVVMCRSGKRGAAAMDKLHSVGMSQARNLDGGILAWKQANLPIVRDKITRLSLMQQVHLTIGIGILTGSMLALTIDVRWIYLCVFFGAGLIVAGSTGWCGLAMLLSKMPWNRSSVSQCSLKLQ